MLATAPCAYRLVFVERCAIVVENRIGDLMKYLLPVVLLFAVCANAQFVKNIDEHGNVTYYR